MADPHSISVNTYPKQSKKLTLQRSGFGPPDLLIEDNINAKIQFDDCVDGAGHGVYRITMNKYVGIITRCQY